MIEIWKDIPNYEGKYQVSNLGNVRSLNFHRENKVKLLKPHKDRLGYLQLDLTKNNIAKKYKVHRLVMLAFVGKDYLTVIHKDGNKENNQLENLEYITIEHNFSYSQPLKIFAINPKIHETLYFNSIEEIRDNGFDIKKVKEVLDRKCDQHKGYEFYYERGGARL